MHGNEDGCSERVVLLRIRNQADVHLAYLVVALDRAANKRVGTGHAHPAAHSRKVPIQDLASVFQCHLCIISELMAMSYSLLGRCSPMACDPYSQAVAPACERENACVNAPATTQSTPDPFYVT